MKAIFFFAALIFLPVSAYAAGPSFDCKKAKRADEKAICQNAVLSDNDIETTRLFQLLKASNRPRALVIAKAFLKERRACGSKSQCIGILQTNAISAFSEALKAYPTAVSVTPGVTAGDTSNPWPDAYSRRDYKLGMTIAQFLSMPFPDLNRDPGAYAVCSNDPRLSNPTLIGYTSVQFVPATWSKAGVVECRYFFNSQITDTYSSVFEAGLGLADAMLMTEFYFIPDDSGKLRLFWIITEGPSDSFARIVPIMQTAYGSPLARTEVWQNQIGNTFNNEIFTWINSASQIEIRHFASEVTKFRLEHRLNVLYAKFGAALQQSDKEAAKRL